jgi:DNA-binding transcriptional ArsR family regulator
MPILQEQGDNKETVVAASAALELMWVLHGCEADHVLGGPFASVEPIRVARGAALKSFWGDGLRGFTEMVALADMSGSLLDLDLDAFFTRLDGAAKRPARTPSLMSETPPERAAIGRRLEILRDDPAMRGNYIALLRGVWDAVSPEWTSSGRPAVLAAAENWRRQLREGVGYKVLLERPRLWLGRPELDELADAASAEGRMVLSPSWFGGDVHIVELQGTLYLGRGVQPRDDDASLRDAAGHVSAHLKALADPTRVAILLWIGRRPASVTEIARHFKLAQPTVSAHVQVLREAGILDEKPDGRSAKLSVSEESLRGMFGGAQDTLLKHFRR